MVDTREEGDSRARLRDDIVAVGVVVEVVRHCC
jgi:hypothetical protein